MAEPAKRKAAYEDLFDLPERSTGEIIGGDLWVIPHPSRRHLYAASSLGGELLPAHGLGRGGGPGGWLILDEPEVKFGEDILVPDLAGWKRDRFPSLEETNRISAVPDWVCEVLSPGTFRIDKVKKMPIYAQFFVPYVWLVNPLVRILDAFPLEQGKWLLLPSFSDSDKVRAEPFMETELELENLWLE